VIWHSEGNIAALLPMAIEAGVVGIHGLDPVAAMDLAKVKRDFGRDLALVGNVDVRVLCNSDLAAVRAEVDLCCAQGARGGGYMLASCNSIFEGMNSSAAVERVEGRKDVKRSPRECRDDGQVSQVGGVDGYLALRASRRKQLRYWLDSAKLPATRAKRIQAIVDEVLSADQ